MTELAQELRMTQPGASRRLRVLRAGKAGGLAAERGRGDGGAATKSRDEEMSPTASGTSTIDGDRAQGAARSTRRVPWVAGLTGSIMKRIGTRSVSAWSEKPTIGEP